VSNLTLKIKNFQIIEDEELCLKPGITLLTGASGNGKSAVLRAFKHLLQNPTPPPIVLEDGSVCKSGVIRVGSKEAKLELNYLSNNIKWVRSLKSSYYEINGEKYDKTGNTNVFKLLDNCGFILDNKNSLLNLEGHKDVLFPFGYTNAEFFKLLESVLPSTDTSKMLQIYKQDEDILATELLQIDKDLTLKQNILGAVRSYTKEATTQRLAELNLKVRSEIPHGDTLKKVLLKSDNFNVYSALLPEVELKIVGSSLPDYLTLYKTYRKAYEVYKVSRIIKEQGTNCILTDSTTPRHSELSKVLQVVKNYDNSQVKIFVPTINTVDKISNYLSILDLIGRTEKYFIQSFIFIKEPNYNKSTVLSEYASKLNLVKKIEEYYCTSTTLLEDNSLILSKISKLQKELEEYKNCPLCGNLL